MYIAIDVGGTKTLIAVYDEKGRIKTESKEPTPQNYDDFIRDTAFRVDTMCQDYEIESVAVAMPGHIEDDNGIVKGFGNLPWKNIDAQKDLHSRILKPLVIDNDANMGALGEANMGAGKGYQKVLYITVSTGIGTGITYEGKIAPVLRESEGGHLMFKTDDGKLVPWEKFASGKAFYEEYGKPGSEINDPKIWKEFAETLAVGLWDLMAVIQPHVIVVGGSMGVHLPKYKKFLEAELNKMESPVVDKAKIVQAQDPDRAVINGCFVAAKELAND